MNSMLRLRTQEIRTVQRLSAFILSSNSAKYVNAGLFGDGFDDACNSSFKKIETAIVNKTTNDAAPTLIENKCYSK